MFQRSHQTHYQIIRDTRDETMNHLIEPLSRNWPDLVSELTVAIQNGTSPSRVGEELTKGFSKLLENLERQKDRKSDEQSRKFHEQERELKKHIDKLTEEKKRLDWEINTLTNKNEELNRQIHIQNTLVADLYRKITNLTGTADPSL